MKWLLPIFLTMIVVAASALVVLAIFNYFLLLRPSLQGKCGGQTLGSPEPARPHLAELHGQVVGKNLWIIQYRWLRRRFKAIGTTLSLVRELPSTVYEGNIVMHGESVGDVVIGKSGTFDFGHLTPGVYDLQVTYPEETMTEFGFIIDPSAPSTEVLIDASPAYYCNCCGWTFEPKSR